jgi:4,5-DOPA dioxygenase extradiol
MDTVLPPVFVSHGSPMIALEPGATGGFLGALGRAIDAGFGRPNAILAVSAHTLARRPVLLAGNRHEAVYDFGPFDPRLFTLRYDPPGAPRMAAALAASLERAGHAPQVVDRGGLDHGIWTALRYLWPGADIPVLPLAWNPHAAPSALWDLGEALAPWTREGVLVLGTGGITHNLGRVFAGGRRHEAEGRPEDPDCAEFRHWWAHRAATADWPSLLDYRAKAPHAVDMHPTDEHLLPWFVPAGAAGPGTGALRLHDAVTYGCLGMDAYAFGDAAPALERALRAQALK